MTKTGSKLNAIESFSKRWSLLNYFPSGGPSLEGKQSFLAFSISTENASFFWLYPIKLDVKSPLLKYIQQCLQLNNVQTLIGASMDTSWTSINFSLVEITIFLTFSSLNYGATFLPNVSSQEHCTFTLFLMVTIPCFNMTLDHL